MSHVTKIILRVLLLRLRSRIRPEIEREQFGFVENAGTRNAIFVLRVITERAVGMQKDIYICFIDYAKAFDKVRHQELFEDLDKLDLYRKMSIYWQACTGIKLHAYEEMENIVSI